MSKYVYGLRKDSEDERDHLMHKKYNLEQIQLPPEFNIKDKCPPVWQQGSEGSCSAHTGCAARSILENDNVLELSRSFLYYQERVLSNNTDSDSGASMRDIGDALHKWGVCKDADMVYDDTDYTTSPNAEQMQKASFYKIKEYLRITTGVLGIKQWLYLKKQPVCMGMDVYESMESEKVAKTGILPIPKKNEKYLGGHAVLIVGYKDNTEKKCFLKKVFNKVTNNILEGYFLVRNSWGNDWGENGYFWMPYSYIEKGYANDFWVMEK